MYRLGPYGFSLGVAETLGWEQKALDLIADNWKEVQGVDSTTTLTEVFKKAKVANWPNNPNALTTWNEIGDNYKRSVLALREVVEEWGLVDDDSVEQACAGFEGIYFPLVVLVMEAAIFEYARGKKGKKASACYW